MRSPAPDPDSDVQSFTQRLAAMDAKVEETLVRGDEVVREGQAALDRLKKTAGIVLSSQNTGQSPACLFDFTECANILHLGRLALRPFNVMK